MFTCLKKINAFHKAYLYQLFMWTYKHMRYFFDIKFKYDLKNTGGKRTSNVHQRTLSSVHQTYARQINYALH